MTYRCSYEILRTHEFFKIKFLLKTKNFEGGAGGRLWSIFMMLAKMANDPQEELAKFGLQSETMKVIYSLKKDLFCILG